MLLIDFIVLLFIFFPFSNRYQQILHRNIVYLATIADASPDSAASTSNVNTAQTQKQQ